MKLEIELIPKTSFFNNLRSLLSPQKWDILRKECYRLAKYRCEICDGVGNKHPVECHEVWDYSVIGIQKLTRLISLCPSCHQVKHIGLAKINGKLDVALLHLSKVNGITLNQAKHHYNLAFDTWSKRNKYQWKLDISVLGENENIQIN